MRRIAINATNLHFGGGVQVAVSFLAELSHLSYPDVEFSVFVSTKVDADLASLSPNLPAFKEYIVRDVRGLSDFLSKSQRGFHGFDVVFTIFGPHYTLFPAEKHVVGFAQAWIIYPNNEARLQLPLVQRLKQRLKFFVQGLFFRNSDAYIVEADHVRLEILRKRYTSDDGVCVVPNCLSAVYHQPSIWQAVEYRPEEDRLNIGFVGRDWVHKNLNILPDVFDLLEYKYGRKVRFVVTLSEDEWCSKSDKFRRLLHNVGPLSVAQCPSFYQKLDGVIFPSLLECFSVTPLEAMAMGKPLFASDRAFVRDVCGDFAVYFDPLSADSIASSIDEYFSKDSVSAKAMTDAAVICARSYCDPTGRARAYVDFLLECAGR